MEKNKYVQRKGKIPFKSYKHENQKWLIVWRIDCDNNSTSEIYDQNILREKNQIPLGTALY